jgi:hypothetical protein
MTAPSHTSFHWQWSPWISIVVGFLIIFSPWLAGLVLGSQFAVLNAVVVGAVVAIVVGVAALVVLVATMFKPG